MNIIVIIGNLGRDPEERFLPSGTKVVTLVVADNQRQKGAERTTWWRVSLWGNQFDTILPHLKKGSSVVVQGEVTKAEGYMRNNEPQASLDVRAHHVTFTPSRPRSEEGTRSESTAMPQQETAMEDGVEYLNRPAGFQARTEDSQNLDEDDLPF